MSMMQEYPTYYHSEGHRNNRHLENQILNILSQAGVHVAVPHKKIIGGTCVGTQLWLPLEQALKHILSSRAQSSERKYLRNLLT